MPKLNQVIAVEKSVKTKAQHGLDTLYKLLQKPALFNGHMKLYKKRVEGTEEKPPETQVVQASINFVFEETKRQLSDLFNITAQKDWANATARADVEVEGQILLKDVPLPYLLFLEKQLTDLGTMVGKLPTLDPSLEWEWDSQKALYRSKPAETLSTKKMQKPIVLYGHTDKHPAQTQLITEDEVVGSYIRTDYSGAISPTEKRALMVRIDKLQHAVKFAREQANMTDAPKQAVAEKILAWIFVTE